ncbi:MAG: response regulator receiver modulated CheB methylesterase [Betaproteobacteria bacterium]|nr:response regulator receiver modulated CheB methylesterase [Betaproteobacteria bacterium]
MGNVRVLVVEDSVTVRNHLCEILRSDPEIEVIGQAGDGKEAIELCLQHRPDVITMDMMLPLMSGLSATEYIMAHCPTPILVVSASINRGELFKTYDALAAGAVDVLEKPRGDDSDAAWERKFLAALKLVSRIPVITHLRAKLNPPARWPRAGASLSNASQSRCKVAALGASTGGPGAIVEVLRSLTPGFPLPLLLVLHINEPFGHAFADWLDGQTVHRVAYAQDGEPLESAAGRVVMAPPGRHLMVHQGNLRLTLDPERHSCRPSVDVLFESLAREHGAAVAACLLTGMGRDGAAGLLEIRRAGGHTIAQDEETSVVYGMPREAVLLGAAERVLPLGEIGGVLSALAMRGGEAESGAAANARTSNGGAAS